MYTLSTFAFLLKYTQQIMMSAKVKKMTAPHMHRAITHLGFTSAAAMKDLLMWIQKGLEEAVKAKKFFII